MDEKRRKRQQVARACQRCASSKRKCSGTFPCERCVRLKLSDSCVEVQVRRRAGKADGGVGGDDEDDEFVPAAAAYAPPAMGPTRSGMHSAGGTGSSRRGTGTILGAAIIDNYAASRGGVLVTTFAHPPGGLEADRMRYGEADAGLRTTGFKRRAEARMSRDAIINDPAYTGSARADEEGEGEGDVDAGDGDDGAGDGRYGTHAGMADIRRGAGRHGGDGGAWRPADRTVVGGGGSSRRISDTGSEDNGDDVDSVISRSGVTAEMARASLRDGVGSGRSGRIGEGDRPTMMRPSKARRLAPSSDWAGMGGEGGDEGAGAMYYPAQHRETPEHLAMAATADLFLRASGEAMGADADSRASALRRPYTGDGGDVHADPRKAVPSRHGGGGGGSNTEARRRHRTVRPDVAFDTSISMHDGEELGSGAVATAPPMAAWYDSAGAAASAVAGAPSLSQFSPHLPLLEWARPILAPHPLAGHPPTAFPPPFPISPDVADVPDLDELATDRPMVRLFFADETTGTPAAPPDGRPERVGAINVQPGEAYRMQVNELGAALFNLHPEDSVKMLYRAKQPLLFDGKPIESNFDGEWSHPHDDAAKNELMGSAVASHAHHMVWTGRYFQPFLVLAEEIVMPPGGTGRGSISAPLAKLSFHSWGGARGSSFTAAGGATGGGPTATIRRGSSGGFGSFTSLGGAGGRSFDHVGGTAAVAGLPSFSESSPGMSGGGHASAVAAAAAAAVESAAGQLPSPSGASARPAASPSATAAAAPTRRWRIDHYYNFFHAVEHCYISYWPGSGNLRALLFVFGGVEFLRSRLTKEQYKHLFTDVGLADAGDTLARAQATQSGFAASPWAPSPARAPIPVASRISSVLLERMTLSQLKEAEAAALATGDRDLHRAIVAQIQSGRYLRLESMPPLPSSFSALAVAPGAFGGGPSRGPPPHLESVPDLLGVDAGLPHMIGPGGGVGRKPSSFSEMGAAAAAAVAASRRYSNPLASGGVATDHGSLGAGHKSDSFSDLAGLPIASGPIAGSDSSHASTAAVSAHPATARSVGGGSAGDGRRMAASGMMLGPGAAGPNSLSPLAALPPMGYGGHAGATMLAGAAMQGSLPYRRVRGMSEASADGSPAVGPLPFSPPPGHVAGYGHGIGVPASMGGGGFAVRGPSGGPSTDAPGLLGDASMIMPADDSMLMVAPPHIGGGVPLPAIGLGPLGLPMGLVPGDAMMMGATLPSADWMHAFSMQRMAQGGAPPASHLGGYAYAGGGHVIMPPHTMPLHMVPPPHGLVGAVLPPPPPPPMRSVTSMLGGIAEDEAGRTPSQSSMGLAWSGRGSVGQASQRTAGVTSAAADGASSGRGGGGGGSTAPMM